MRKAIAFCIIAVFLTAFHAKSVRAMESQREKKIITLLSEVKYSDDLINTVHNNENVLKAIGLYLQITDRKNMSDDEMTVQLVHLFTEAGWSEWVPVMRIRSVKDTLYLVSIGYAFGTQSSSLYVFYDSSYKKIATGENGLIDVIDYKLAGNELGVIFNRVPGSTAFEPDFALLREEKGKWNICWTPERQRTWIDIDGEIKFLKDNLSLIQVKGSSFGLQSATKQNKDEVFLETHPFEHRFFVAIWEKKDCAYVRRTTLPPDAPFYDKLWEMTDFSESRSFYAPYATVFEFLRRLRDVEDKAAADLSSDKIVEEAKNLDLSNAYDSKGDIIFYDAGFIYPEKEQERILQKLTLGNRAIFFHKNDRPDQFIAVLEPVPTGSGTIHWRVVEIQKIVPNP